jgi:hypothetical protein
MPPFGSRSITAKLDEILVGLANIRSQIGVLRMSTQADAAALATAIETETAAWQAWASNIETILTNVENALTAAQNANPAVDLTDAQNAVAAGQAAVGALPVETDPTVTPPAPAPTPTPGS